MASRSLSPKQIQERTQLHRLTSAEFNRPHESDAVIHEDWARLIDGQVDQPTGPITGGGGPVSENVRRTDRDGQWSGSGRKGPKYANPLGAQGQGNLRKPR
jgi:hypothetical protein